MFGSRCLSFNQELYLEKSFRLTTRFIHYQNSELKSKDKKVQEIKLKLSNQIIITMRALVMYERRYKSMWT